MNSRAGLVIGMNSALSRSCLPVDGGFGAFLIRLRADFLNRGLADSRQAEPLRTMVQSDSAVLGSRGLLKWENEIEIRLTALRVMETCSAPAMNIFSAI